MPDIRTAPSPWAPNPSLSPHMDSPALTNTDVEPSSLQFQHGLTHAALTALKWNYLGATVRIASSFLIGIFLARLLGPRPFGQVAVAWLVIGLGNLMADCGFGAALVQRREVTCEHIRFAFTAQALLGLLLSASVALGAPWIAWVFRQPETVPVIRALAAVFTLQAFGLTAANLLKRSLEFGRLQRAQVISYLAGYLALGLPLACCGFGVWSLIAAQLAQTFLLSAQLYLAVRHPIRPLLRLRYRELNSFGSKVVGVNLANWTIGNVDTAVVGRAFGAVSLGLYDRALILLTTPMNGIVTTLQAVLFPTYARAQHRPELVRRAYLTSVAAVQLCLLPVFVLIAMIPRTVIEGLFGSRWPAAVPLLVPLSLALPFRALMALAGPLLWGVGKVERELRVQVAIALVFIPALLVASRGSLSAVAWTVFSLLVLQSILMTRATLKVASVAWRELLRLVRGPALLTAVTAPLVRAGDHGVFLSLSPVLRLSVDALASSVLSFALVLGLPRLFLCDELRELIRRHFRGIARWTRLDVAEVSVSPDPPLRTGESAPQSRLSESELPAGTLRRPIPEAFTNQ